MEYREKYEEWLSNPYFDEATKEELRAIAGDEGEIKVDIYSEGEDVIFSVSDNGVGMTKEQCEDILKKDGPGRTGGIGIKNVNDRVKIYFGDKYGINIESEPDVGTKVTIRMPKIEEEYADAK